MAEAVNASQAGGVDGNLHRGDGVQDMRSTAEKRLCAELGNGSVGELGGALIADLLSPGDLGPCLAGEDNCLEGVAVSVGEC